MPKRATPRQLAGCRPTEINPLEESTKPGHQEFAAAELALKAHAFASDPSISAETQPGDRVMAKISESVNLTEAPEDAICSLVLDLMHYCERVKIDWTDEIMSVAMQRVGSENTVGVPGK